MRLLLIADRCGPGDAIRIRPLIQALCTSLPDSRIALVCSEQAAPVLSQVDGLSRVIISRLFGRRRAIGARAHVRKSGELVRLLLQVGLGWDVAVVFLWGSAYLDLLARLSSRKAVGYQSGPAFLLSSRLGRYSTDPDFEQNLALLRAAGLEVGEVAPRVRTECIEAARALLRRQGIPPDEPLVLLHPGSDWACQQWRPERWGELIDELWDRHHPRLVLTGSAPDSEHVAQIQRHTSAPLVSLLGQTSMAELEGVVGLAELVLCVDSLVYDVAQAAGTPVVALTGPSPAWIAPGTRSIPRIVNETPHRERQQISACQGGHSNGRCQDWDCPFAGLPLISVDRVLKEIGDARLGASRAAPSIAAPADEQQVM